ELVTNAIRYSGLRNPKEPGHCRLTLERPAPDTVRIEVSDSSTTRPAKREPGEDETGGRGLVLVEALAVDWGVTRRPVGKTVWALLRAQP
ncbi:ATP-binding protein, partial [Streptomyces hirsutus]